MTVRVEVQKNCPSKDGIDWRCLGWVAGSGLLLHNVDVKGEKVRAKIGLIEENGAKVKTAVSLGGKLDAAFIEKAVKVAVSKDGRYVAMTGVRKKTGGYLVIWGRDGPKNPVVHQDVGNQVAVLGTDKKSRPQALALSPLGTNAVILASDNTILIWRRVKVSHEGWEGVWCSIQPDMLLPPAAFDAAFVTSTEFHLTSARLAPAVGDVNSPPLTVFNETTPTSPHHGDFHGTARYSTATTSSVASPAQRLCLTVTHRVGVLGSLPETLPPTGIHHLPEGYAEFAVQIPEEEAITHRDIPSMKWDDAGSVLAILLVLKTSRVVFMVPGHPMCHTVSLPSEMQAPTGVCWVANSTFVAVTDKSGRFVLISRLGTSTRLLTQTERTYCYTPPGGAVLGNGGVVAFHSPKGTVAGVSNGSGVTVLSLNMGPDATRLVLEGKLPEWVTGPGSGVKSVVTLGWLVGSVGCDSLCNAVTSLASVVAVSMEGKNPEKQLTTSLKMYKETISSLEWVAGVLGVSSIPILRAVSTKMTRILCTTLCEKMVRGADKSHIAKVLEATYHALTWSESALTKIESHTTAGAVRPQSLPCAEYVFKEFWLMLMGRVVELGRDGGLEVLQEAVRVRMLTMQEARQDLNVLNPKELGEIHKGHDAYLGGVDKYGMDHYIEAGRPVCALSACLLHVDPNQGLTHCVTVLATSTEKWGTKGLLHTPTLLLPTPTPSHIAVTLSRLLSAVVLSLPIYILPAVYCDTNLSGVIEYKAGGKRVPLDQAKSDLVERHFQKASGGKLAELTSELWCATGHPLESLHISMSSRLPSTTEGVMKLIQYQLSIQEDWSEYLRNSNLPCRGKARSSDREQFSLYGECRDAVKRVMLSEDTTTKVYRNAGSKESAVRSGRVCPHCVESLLSFFLLKSVAAGDLAAPQKILTYPIAPRTMRAAACGHLLTLVRSMLTHLPPFTLKALVKDIPSPVTIIHQALSSPRPVSDEVANTLRSSPPPADVSTPQRAASYLQTVSRLLAWSLVCAAPSSEPSMCSNAALEYLTQYKEATRTGEPVGGLPTRVREVLRYAWALQVWHRMHSELTVKTQVLAVPGSVAETVVEITGEGVLWASKLAPFSHDIWSLEAVQGAVLSALELCNDARRVYDCMKKSFYEKADMDSVYTVAQVRRAQYRRIVKELSTKQQDKLITAQGECFEVYKSKRDSMRSSHKDGLPSLTHDDICWMHELDGDFWDYVSNVMVSDIFTAEGGTTPPKEGWKELLILTRLISTRGDKNETIVVPYGVRTTGEKVVHKGAPKQGSGDGSDAAPKPPQPPKTDAKPEEEQKQPESSAPAEPSVPSAPAAAATPGPVGPTPQARKGSKAGLVKGTPVTKGTPRVVVPTPIRVPDSAVPTKCKAGTGLPKVLVAVAVDEVPSPVAVRRPRRKVQAPVDLSLPYELLPVSHGGLLLDVSTPGEGSETPPSPKLGGVVGGQATPLGVRRKLLESPRGAQRSEAIVAEALKALTPARRHPAPDTATTMTTTDSGTTYSNMATTVTTTSTSVTGPGMGSMSTPTASVSVPDPVSAFKPVSPAKKHGKKDRKKKKEEEDPTAARHDNRGVGTVHYHYSENTTHNEGGGGGVKARDRRRVCRHQTSNKASCKKCGRHKQGGGLEPPSMLLQPSNPIPAYHQTATAAMLRAHSAAARNPRPNPDLGLLQTPCGIAPPDPPVALPQPILLRPQAAPKLPPKVPAPLSEMLTRPEQPVEVPPIPMVPRPRTPEGARVAPPAPVESPGWRLTEAAAVGEINTAEIALSPMRSPDLVGKGVPTEQIFAPEKKDITHDPMSPDVVELLARQASLHGVGFEKPMTPAEVAIKTPILDPGVGLEPTRTPVVPEAATLIGQPVLTATEELLYAKYIKQLGIQATDAVISSEVAAITTTYTPSVLAAPSDVPTAIDEVNAKHEAMQEVKVVKSIIIAPTPQQPQPQPPIVEQPPQHQAALDDLVSGMAKRQEAAAASAGRELATAFTDTLKNLSPQIATALEQSAHEGRKMERDGMIRFLQDEGTQLSALARSRLHHPENPSSSANQHKQPPRALDDEEYKKWVEKQKVAASKPVMTDAAVDASERPGVGLQTVMPEVEGVGVQVDGGYLAVREITEESHWAGERKEAVGVRDYTMEVEVVGEGKRKFLSVQDTQPLDEPFSKVSDTRRWAVESSLSRLERDIDKTFERAGDVDATVREATAAVKSCEAVLRDAQRLRGQRRTTESIDVLREEAKRIEARLSATLNPPAYTRNITPLPSSPPPKLVAVQKSPTPQHGGRSFISTVDSEPPHYKESYSSQLQELVEDNAAGREPFLWQNTTKQKLPIKIHSDNRTVTPVLVSCDTVPLIMQAGRATAGVAVGSPSSPPPPPQPVVFQQQHTSQHHVKEEELPVGETPRPVISSTKILGSPLLAPSSAVKEVEETPTKQKSGVVPVSRTKSKTGNSGGTPLAPVPARVLNTYSAQRTRPRQATQRRNKDVPLKLQGQIDRLGALLDTV